eukprot:gene14687-biopygen10479
MIPGRFNHLVHTSPYLTAGGEDPTTYPQRCRVVQPRLLQTIVTDRYRYGGDGDGRHATGNSKGSREHRSYGHRIGGALGKRHRCFGRRQCPDRAVGARSAGTAEIGTVKDTMLPGQRLGVGRALL